MTVIKKINIQPANRQTVSFPAGANILKITSDKKHNIHMFILCDEDFEEEEEELILVPTGQEVPEEIMDGDFVYLNTFPYPGTSYAELSAFIKEPMPFAYMEDDPELIDEFTNP